MPESSIIPQLILIVILTSLNAFFASAEIALVSLNKNRINILASKGNKKAKLLENLLINPSKFLSTIQVGITLGGFFSSASAATGIADNLSVYLNKINIPYSTQISVVLITIILAYFTLVFGELVPKQLALKKTEKIAFFSVRPINFISKIALPFVKLLSLSTNTVVKLLGIHKDQSEDQISEEEIRSILESSHRQGNINQNERDMIHSVFEFNDKTAKEIQTVKSKVFMIDINEPFENYIDELISRNFSRIPVYEKNMDKIMGILYLKEFLSEAYKHGFKNVDIKKILHPPIYVNQNTKIDVIFKKLQPKKNYMAIILNDYERFTGIITIEDLVEEIVGNIYDEFN